MKRTKCVLAVALTVFLCLGMVPVGAAPPKRPPVPPKDWAGRIHASHLTSASALAFEQNGCDWGPAAPLDGGDALIWEVKEYAGLEATTTWKTTQPGSAPQNLTGYFLDEDCVRVNGVLWQHSYEAKDVPQKIVIPENAVWSVVQATWFGVSAEIDVKMHSDGYTPPKKKKKKKKKS